MNILLVEDDAGLVELITVKLEESGFSVMSAASGAEALTHLERQTPDMMLLDYSLPDINGKELVDTLNKQQTPLPPFIITTGQGDERIAVNMMKLGAMDYLVKDILFLEKLSDVVKRVVKEIDSDGKLKQAQKAFIESEERLRGFMDSATDGFMLFDSELNQIDINDAALKMTRQKREGVIGKNMLQLLPDIETSGRYDKYKEIIRTGNPITFNDVISHTKSGKKHVLLKAFKVGQGLGMIITDISEKFKSEQELKKSEATIKNKLKAITEPEGDIGSLELSDIIDAEVLQFMMEDFYELTGMLGAVLDVSGKVLIAVGWQDICTKFHRCNPHTLKNCIESDTILTQGVPEGTFRSYHCKNNMWDIVTPIMVGGRHVGNVFMGQYFLEDEVPNVEFFRNQAKKYGFDEKEYLAALDRVPCFSKKTVEAGMQFYSKLAGIISKLSFSAIQQSRMLTEYKLTEQSLQKSEERFNLAMAATKDGLFDRNLVTNEIYYSPGWKSMLGYEDEELPNDFSVWEKLTEPEDVERSWKMQKELINKQRDRFEFEFKMKHKDGHWVDILSRAEAVYDKNDKAIRMVGTHVDISERKKTEAKILAAEEKYRTMIETSNDLIWMLDHEYNFTFLNAHAEKATGYLLNDLKGKSFLSLVMEDELPFLNEIFTKTMSGKSISYEMSLKTGYGNILTLAVNTAPLSTDGEVQAIFSFARDITQQKEAEQALKESEKRFKALHNASFGGIAIHDKGIIKDCNQGLSDITGYTLEELIGMDGLLCIAEDSRIVVMQNILASYEKAYEVVGLRKNGVEYPLRLEGKTIPYEGKNMRAVEFKDITERKNAELALSQKEEQKQTILKTALDGFFIYDIKGRFTEVNNTFCKMSGYSEEELLAMAIFDISCSTSPIIAERIKNITLQVNDKYESKLTQKDGSIIDVEISAQSQTTNGGQTVCFVHDITKRKYSEREQKLTELRLDAQVKLNQMTGKSLDEIYNYTLDKAIKLTNSKIGFLGFVNADETIVTIYNWLGIIKDECEVENINIEFVVEKSGIWGEVIRNRDVLLLNDFNAANLLKRGVPEGHVKIEKYLSIPVFSENKIVAIIAVSNKEGDYNKADIKRLTLLLDSMWNFVTQYKSQNDLKIAKEKAEESDRLKSAFLANMSHEIRTPMNGILGFTSLLLEPGLTGETQVQYINIIQKSGDRMLNTVNDIIEISRIETGQVNLVLKEINLNVELGSLYNFFKLEVENKGMQLFLENDFSTEEAIIRTDESKLSSILTNLIKNAIKYSSQGSIKIAYKRKGEQLEFTVKDTGMGIPKNRQEAIFERFIQADIDDREVYEGSGLGLAITKTYVEMLGGKIWVESEKGKGSTFHFTINYNLVGIEKAMVNEIEIANEDIKENLILVAEDDDVSYLLVESILALENCRLIRAKTGKEVVSICENNPEISLLLLDLKMPVMDGIEAVKLIRKFNIEVPIIAQTAYALPGDREIAINAGCNDYVTKPLNRKNLKSKVNSYLKPENN